MFCLGNNGNILKIAWGIIMDKYLLIIAIGCVLYGADLFLVHGDIRHIYKIDYKSEGNYEMAMSYSMSWSILE